ncbi:MAG: T9SS type A sorting domain-containing protein [Flavobacteriaceae bacterium]|nr:T9SS type A sorting domain-containing protein [Flavobacteriaceae bacterium]
MRRFLFSILFIISISEIHAQTYTPMLENGKIWNMKYETWTVGIPNSTITTLYGYFIDGTTTFNATTYYVLRDSRNTTVYYLREDIANKKVYLYETSSNTEKLLYDFNVQVGDVFNADKLNAVFTSTERTVVATGTEMKFGINTKFYTLASTNNNNCVKVYEGVGLSPEGLIDDPINCTTFDPNYRYTLTNINQTLALTDYPYKNNFYIFYDANSQQLKINKVSNTFKIKMYSALGQIVLDTQLKGMLDVSQLKKGLYFYTLSSNKTVLKGKFFIY